MGSTRVVMHKKLRAKCYSKSNKIFSIDFVVGSAILFARRNQSQRLSIANRKAVQKPSNRDFIRDVINFQTIHNMSPKWQ